MITANGTVTLRPKEVVPIYREKWDATVEDYKYDLFNRDFVSRNGVIYQVKKQRVNEFVPAGLDPAGENGEDYWEAFNNLAPSVANFLIIIDEDGEPATLLSGGRIQARFLNIGSLNMSETRLWGGAEPMTGKGLALINDPGDRKFVVYENANNYVEMFQREDEWGLKGVVAGKDIFQLGNINKIGPFSVYSEHLYFQNKQMSNDLWMSMQLGAAGDNNNGFDLYVSWIEQSPALPLGEKTAMHVKLNTSRNGQAILAESKGYRDNMYNYAIRAIGNCRVEDGVLSIENGYIKGMIVSEVATGNFATARITPYIRYFLHHSTGNVSRAMSDSWGVNGQVLTIVNCDNDNYNLTLTNIWQFNKNGGVTSASIEMTDGGAEVTLIKYGGKWLFAGRSGNAKF